MEKNFKLLNETFDETLDDYKKIIDEEDNYLKIFIKLFLLEIKVIKIFIMKLFKK